MNDSVSQIVEGAQVIKCLLIDHIKLERIIEDLPFHYSLPTICLKKISDFNVISLSMQLPCNYQAQP